MLYLNENIALRLVELLQSKGFKAIHTLDVGNRGISDEAQLEYAAARQYVLLTHNRADFRRLHRVWTDQGKQHAGIVIIKHELPERVSARVHLFFERVYPSVKLPFCLSPPPLH